MPHFLRLECDSLTCAGGQMTANGRVSIYLESVPGPAERFHLHINACLRGKRIRSIKVILKGLPRGCLSGLREAREIPIADSGAIFHYPEGWRGLYTPCLLIRKDDSSLWFARSLDTQVRDKWFTLLPSREDITQMDIELIHEERAVDMGASIVVPVWEFGKATSPESVWEEQRRHLESAYHLEPWEERSDVPEWARQISLVVALHGQHWTGRIFLDYARMRECLRWITERIEGRRILAYLPGWEGRYYWQYGDYHPDDRMGGAEGFHRLIVEAHAMGVRVIPMFGMNYANRGLPNFEQWGAPAETGPASGRIVGTGGVDWDGSRNYDNGWGAMLNPGAPTWQNHLVHQIRSLTDEYGFDGAFLDISAVWVNDPRRDTYAGVSQIAERLREGRPEFLIAGEGWYDAVGRATPLMQSGHSDGVMHWHDEIDHPLLFGRYHRCFGHLCLGDPGRGSTGVHELGFNSTTTAPLRRAVLPTLTLIDDTLERAPEKVERIIADAQEYARRYLSAFASPFEPVKEN